MVTHQDPSGSPRPQRQHCKCLIDHQRAPASFSKRNDGSHSGGLDSQFPTLGTSCGVQGTGEEVMYGFQCHQTGARRSLLSVELLGHAKPWRISASEFSLFSSGQEERKSAWKFGQALETGNGTEWSFHYPGRLENQSAFWPQ